MQLRTTSTSNHAVAGKSSDLNHWRRKPEIKQLEERLKILEQEAEMFKGALLESVEESRKLITDAQLHFNTIQHCLLQREAIQIVSHQKERRAGLPQILCQESNPSIVKKGLRTKASLKVST
ncbi:hypothetical protein C2S51_018944 [Perilla frutescens var. frutescens]|nr:hypothetical protein C2S51_018944 [Perilla frutescens var. frutescens]